MCALAHLLSQPIDQHVLCHIGRRWASSGHVGWPPRKGACSGVSESYQIGVAAMLCCRLGAAMISSATEAISLYSTRHSLSVLNTATLHEHPACALAFSWATWTRKYHVCHTAAVCFAMS